MADGFAEVAERGVLTAPQDAWSLARSRAAVVAELAALDVVGHEAADEAAVAMGLSRRQVYSLVARWRSGSGAVSDLLPGRSSGGRGRSRVPSEVEAVIGDVLRARYLRRQRPSVASVHRSILRACRLRGLPAPSRGTIERRIAALEPRAVATARGGTDAARPLRSAGGEPPSVHRLLEQVQIDHTVIDLVVVDDQLRAPVGRPYLTVAIDVLSRAIVGLVVTLDPPSTTSVGLCLSHMVSDKQVWLEHVGAAVAWPMSGKPAEIFVDNGAEFHSEALTRGCEEHGIALRYRPEGAPHYGGVVERLIGTLMREVHELPGTTFSNPIQRGAYDSDATAALTLAELHRWLALLVSTYHQQVHDSLGRPPAAVWAEQAAAQPPKAVRDPTAFLVDFLPVLRRRLTRTGVQIDHIHYFSDALKPLIARRARLDRLVVRRDPRDLSRVWVLDPDSDAYLPVGYRFQSRPAISLWEQRAAAARLRELGRSEVDEQALFETVETMREISDTAVRSSRRARRARVSILEVDCAPELRILDQVQRAANTGVGQSHVHGQHLDRSALHRARSVMAGEDLAGAERGLLAASEADWALARMRAAVVRELAHLDAPGHEAVDRAALALDLSRRQTYSLLLRWRAGDGRVSDLLPRRSSGGRGKGRLPDDVEAVIKDVLRKRYLKRQRPSVASVHRSIVRACRVRGLSAPSRGAVERRIAVLDPRAAAGSRGGPDAARKVDSAGGSTTTPVEPLGQVQIDHTVIDVVLVDEQDRAPIGRPFLTVGIDVTTRAIVGMVVTLDPPSATSVGLCLAHIATDKQAWLETLGAQVSWPMAGKPAQLYVDNGAEFHSEALRRGCEEHGIALDYRPPGEPQYGGVVERLIGTLMSEVHELPGTTFSNPVDRGPYDSEATAALTLLELQRWLAFAVAAYHHQVHEGHGRPPLAVWEEKATAHPPTTVANPRSFLVDFLPVVRRRLNRTGLVIDHVHYFSDTLKPLIARRQQIGQVVVRRDPRDLSRVWVLDPQSNAYLSVGYRHLAHPAISLWEHRAAVASLREKGRGEVDEQALFASVEQMRHVSDTATKSTRRARRERQRRPVASTPSPGPIAVPPPPPDLRRDARAEEPAPAPFDDIEEW